MLLSNSYREMQGLLAAVYSSYVPKTEVLSAIIPGEQRQAVLLDVETLGDTSSNVSVLSLLQTARAPKRSEARLNLPVPHSLVRYPVSRHGVNYRC